MRCSEPRDTLRPIIIKFNSPSKRLSDSFIPDKAHRNIFESGGDGTSKSSVGQPQVKTIERKTEVKYFPKVEWSLAYSEDNGDLLLIMAKSN